MKQRTEIFFVVLFSLIYTGPSIASSNHIFSGLSPSKSEDIINEQRKKYCFEKKDRCQASFFDEDLKMSKKVRVKMQFIVCGKVYNKCLKQE